MNKPRLRRRCAKCNKIKPRECYLTMASRVRNGCIDHYCMSCRDEVNRAKEAKWSGEDNPGTSFRTGVERRTAMIRAEKQLRGESIESHRPHDYYLMPRARVTIRSPHRYSSIGED
jgi:hypothetical protein